MLFLSCAGIFVIDPATLLIASIAVGLKAVISIELRGWQAPVAVAGVLLPMFLLPPSVHECNRWGGVHSRPLH